MDSSMCSSAPDPEMWIIQGTLAWRTPPVRTGVRSNVDPTFDSLVGSRGGTTMAPLFSRIHTSLISVWTAISRAQV
ncbi:hypothetical protein RJ640_015999 [Escallonia rubra]|uniref:Uncharacterized protein ycf68 n=1 Tax=Escallonia rubra TaxID=112253 RepID=A0AA88UFS2_9ASTE|nr:hypothetical protein RJ640_015999 [Escallonia rubra]